MLCTRWSERGRGCESDGLRRKSVPLAHRKLTPCFDLFIAVSIGYIAFSYIESSIFSKIQLHRFLLLYNKHTWNILNIILNFSAPIRYKHKDKMNSSCEFSKQSLLNLPRVHPVESDWKHRKYVHPPLLDRSIKSHLTILPNVRTRSEWSGLMKSVRSQRWHSPHAPVLG